MTTRASTTTRRRAPTAVERPAGAVRTLRQAWRGPGAQRPALYVLLFATVVVLNVVGLVMVLSASSVVAEANYGSAWFFFERQILWTLLGIGTFVVVARVDYRKWRRLALPLLALSAGLLVLVLVPGVGIHVDGATRWLGTGSLRFQPTEVAKLALLLFSADLLTRRAREIYDWRLVVAPVLGVLAIFSVLVLKQPDLDSTIVLGLIAFALLIVGGVRMKHLMTLGVAGISLAALLAVGAGYRRARVFAFLDPWSDSSNTGYQIAQSLIALGSGGWTGVGLGAGRAKWMFLPNAHTDFIFAIIGEELGLVGCLIVVALFVAFAVFGVLTAVRAPDRFGMLVAAGVTVWVVGQAIINIGAVIGLLPVSGIPLPFVSFGGSALVFTMVAAGILGNIARQGRPAASGTAR
ncbi:MAG: putative lipid II flippase FtsW [Acidimicrobiia bacterium]